MPESQNIKRVKHLLAQGEGIRLEYKKSHTQLPNTLFESICAMLNRDGGDILLGADNDGNILGLDATKIETMSTNLVNLSNNPEKLDPPFYFVSASL